MKDERAYKLVEKCVPRLVLDAPDTQPLGVKDIKLKQLCRLWAGMGHIYRVDLWSGKYKMVIKHVTPPSRNQQSLGDQRKAHSYEVESNFYEKLAADLIQNHDIRLPTPYHVEHGPASGEVTICMSLLVGSPVDMARRSDVKGSLSWLAKFHAAYWGSDRVDHLIQKVGLQETGSYWHLDTRPDEHRSMSRKGWEGRLWRAARAIDSCLKRDPMQCLIHGDAKEANMMVLDKCNNNDERIAIVAMYDLQYCGKGTPTRDIAYFLCSSCDEDEENELVEYYFNELIEHLSLRQTENLPSLKQFKESLELAFCDFCRFMCGWGHWGYDIQSRVKSFLDKLDGGKDLGSEEAYDKAIRKILW